LSNQIMILTEERDSARQQEEELYGILKEKINDLERLQESYVDMTDRCNDYQDTMADMREEMDSLKEVMLTESRQFITASQSSTGLSLTVSLPHLQQPCEGEAWRPRLFSPPLLRAVLFPCSRLVQDLSILLTFLPLLSLQRPHSLATSPRPLWQQLLCLWSLPLQSMSLQKRLAELERRETPMATRAIAKTSSKTILKPKPTTGCTRTLACP
jgi:hypothetical protein